MMEEMSPYRRVHAPHVSGYFETVRTSFDLAPLPNNGQLLVVTTVVDDPRYLTQPFIVSSHFKKEADGSKWDPTPCSSTW